MQKLLLVFVLLPFFSFAQQYAGVYVQPELHLQYNVLLLIRPDSTISLTFETVSLKSKKSTLTNYPDLVLYYDYHGVIKQVSGRGACYTGEGYPYEVVDKDTCFYVDSKEIFSYTVRQFPYQQNAYGNDTLEILYDSVKTFVKKKLYADYGNVHDSICRPWYKCYGPAWGFPHALNDSAHIVPNDPDYLPVDTVQYKSAKKMMLDIGYVNPVSGLPVTFPLAYGSYPAFKGEEYGGQFHFMIKGGRLYFYDCDGPYGYADSYPLVLTEIK